MKFMNFHYNIGKISHFVSDKIERRLLLVKVILKSIFVFNRSKEILHKIRKKAFMNKKKGKPEGIPLVKGILGSVLIGFEAFWLKFFLKSISFG